jgi:hypothetical protein
MSLSLSPVNTSRHSNRTAIGLFRFSGVPTLFRAGGEQSQQKIVSLKTRNYLLHFQLYWLNNLKPCFSIYFSSRNPKKLQKLLRNPYLVQ